MYRYCVCLFWLEPPLCLPSTLTRAHGRRCAQRKPVVDNTTTLEGPILVRGKPFAFRVITPAVARAAREYFACDGLTGLELSPYQSNLTDGETGSCYQSHWDQCLVWGDVMSKRSRPPDHCGPPLCFGLFATTLPFARFRLQ